MVQPLWKTVSKVSKTIITKLNVFLSYDPAIMDLGIFPKDVKTSLHTNLHTMLIAALVIITNNGKQPRCLSVGEWTKTAIARQ